jgi:penicillin-binding protein 1A
MAPATKQAATPTKKKMSGILVAVMAMGMLMVITTISGGAFLVHQVVSNPSFPKLDNLLNQPVQVSTEVYDNTGTHLIGEIFQTRRTKVQLKDVSPQLIAALIAAEDANYNLHHGVDWWGTVKGLVRHPGHPTGGSTITQQVVKNLLWMNRGITPRDYRAKIEEWALAMELEKRMSKNAILELYVNTIYLGQNRYGVEAAARNYFGKNAAEISLGEAALLVALPKGPNTYTHWTNPAGKAKALAKWKTRQLYVLERMKKHRKATAAEAKAAADAPIQLAENAGIDLGIGDEFVDVVQKELVTRYGERLFRTQLKVTTTADWRMQNAAKQAVEEGTKTLDHLNGENPRPQAAQMTIDENGNVLAMVGGWGYRRGRSLNRATQTERQAGSLFKTLLWLAGFESGKVKLDSQFVDQETTIPAPEAGAGDWTPHDHHEATGEQIDLGLALAKSLNRVAGQLVYALRTENNPLAGVDLTIDVARRIGVTAKLGRNYAMVLGTSSVKLSEMTMAYNTISNSGKRPNLRFILSIQEGNAEAKQEPFKAPEQAVKGEAAHMTNVALQRVTTEGTGVRAGRELKRPIAGKTGTTQEAKDGWFCGSLTADQHVFTTCTWVGYDNNASLGKVQVGPERGKDFEGSSTALRQIWIPFAKAVFQGKPVEEFRMPTDEVDTTAAAAQPVAEEAAPTTEQPTAETPATPETEEEKPEQQLPFPF